MSPATEASLKEVMEILEQEEGTCLWSGEGCTDCRTCEEEGCGCQGPTHRDGCPEKGE
jgi:hypothetical protein